MIPDDAVIWRAPRTPELHIEALERNDAATLPDKFLVVIGINTWHTTALVGAQEIFRVGTDAHCMQHALFKPSEVVQEVGVWYCVLMISRF